MPGMRLYGYRHILPHARMKNINPAKFQNIKSKIPRQTHREKRLSQNDTKSFNKTASCKVKTKILSCPRGNSRTFLFLNPGRPAMSKNLNVFSAAYGLLINGEWTKPGDLLESVNPANGQLLAKFTDATEALNCDETGSCRCVASSIPLAERGPADPAVPSSIERLEQVFTLSPAIMKSIIFPAQVSDAEAQTLISDSYRRYGIMFDTATAHAYSAAQNRNIFRQRSGESLVLVSKDHPAFESEILTRICGESPIIPEYLHGIDTPIPNVPLIKGTKEELIKILNTISEVQ